MGRLSLRSRCQASVWAPSTHVLIGERLSVGRLELQQLVRYQELLVPQACSGYSY